MTTLAALAIPALAILAIITLSYGWLCMTDPFATCSACHGGGKVLTNSGRSRPCRACKEYGIRLRVGRHVLNKFLRDRDDRRALDQKKGFRK